MADDNPLGVKEQRLTPDEFEEALVKFAKLAPDIVDEAEYRHRLRETILYRYKQGGKLLEEVAKLLEEVGKKAGGGAEKELQLVLKKVDEAVVQMTHGALGFNKGAVAGVRNLLQITRPKG